MSNNVCKKYMNAVKSFFPAIGKEEKKYLKNLRSIMEDYYEEKPDCTVEDLFQEFGQPAEVVSNFYANANPALLVKRINLVITVRKFLIGILIAVICIAITYFFYAYQAQKILHHNRIFFEETIIE